jgi:hypothetical protein
MAAFDLEKIYQYPDGRDLLNATLVEHERLLWELEDLAKEPQRDANSDITNDITNKLNLVKAQILLFERLMIGKKIDSLVVLVNHYAEKLSQPRVEIGKATLQ